MKYKVGQTLLGEMKLTIAICQRFSADSDGHVVYYPFDQRIVVFAITRIGPSIVLLVARSFLKTSIHLYAHISSIRLRR
jgi:hypothetical protein